MKEGNKDMIKIQNLSLVYPSGKGIFNVDFTIHDGEVFGYLGPNGSGKTTTIRGILGHMNVDEGIIRINDYDPRSNPIEINQLIGYLPGEIAFFEHFTGIEFLEFIRKMRGLKNVDRRNQLLKHFELDPNGKIKKMSKGMKQKLGIVAAFMHDPEILILDEPTSGLDPLMQNRFLELVLEEKKRGKTILISSHIFEEVERVCDRAGIIKEGKIITVEDFNENTKKISDIYEVKMAHPSDQILKTKLDIVKIKEATYQISVKDNYKEFFKILSEYDVIQLELKKQTIEDIFMKYYGGDLDD